MPHFYVFFIDKMEDAKTSLLCLVIFSLLISRKTVSESPTNTYVLVGLYIRMWFFLNTFLEYLTKFSQEKIQNILNPISKYTKTTT